MSPMHPVADHGFLIIGIISAINWAFLRHTADTLLGLQYIIKVIDIFDLSIVSI